MKKTCTPLVMSLHPLWVRKMLNGEKTMELRRVFPLQHYAGLGDTIAESEQYLKPIYFVKTGTTKGGYIATVNVYAELYNIGRLDLTMAFAESKATDMSKEFRHVEYRDDEVIIWHSALSWERALKYQGHREKTFLLLLKNIREVHFPVTFLGLENSPQSYAYAKKVPTFEQEFLNERR